jgi:hypothetical protein
MEPGTTVEQHPWNTRALDEASFRAGIEAAATLIEKMGQGRASGWVQLEHTLLAGCILRIPMPSTLPQEGGEQ